MKIHLTLIYFVFSLVVFSSCKPNTTIARRSYTYELSDYKINHRKKISQIKVDYISRDSVALNKWIFFLELSKSDTLRNKYMSLQLNDMIVSKNAILNLYGSGFVSLIIGASMDNSNLLYSLPQYISLPIIELPILAYGGYVLYYKIKYSIKAKPLIKSIPELNEIKYIYGLKPKFIKKSSIK